MKKTTITLIVFVIFAGIFFLSPKVNAQNYTLLEPLPGIGANPSDLGTYIATLITLGIALAAMLAVVMIVVAGFMYITATGSPGKVEKAKTIITNAIIGLLIAVGYWLILQAINPAILSGEIGALQKKPDLLDVIDGQGPTHGAPGLTVPKPKGLDAGERVWVQDEFLSGQNQNPGPIPTP